MIKKIATTLLCFITVLSFTACSNNHTQEDKGKESNEATTQQTSDAKEDQGSDEEKIEVSVTFHALKEFTEIVGGDKVNVKTIIPEGVEAHDFEPKAQDLAALSEAQIFVYNGLGMESWAEDAVASANNESLIVVEASKGADVIETEEEHEDEEHEEEEHEEDGHDHGKFDPHMWLSLKGAQSQVTNIKDALVEADPDNKEYYEENSSQFIAQLEALFSEYNEKFEQVTKKNFVTGHAAFGYLCRDFGLEQTSVSNIFAEGEPSAQQLAQLVEYCKENEVTTIFAEELASPQVSETLANEVGAKVETIYTMESSEGDLTYLDRMSENLSKIYESLQ